MQMLITRSQRSMGELDSTDVASTHGRGEACDRAKGRGYVKRVVVPRGQTRFAFSETKCESKRLTNSVPPSSY